MNALLVEIDDKLAEALKDTQTREKRTKRAIVEMALEMYIAKSRLEADTPAKPAARRERQAVS